MFHCQNEYTYVQVYKAVLQNLQKGNQKVKE